MRKAPDDPVRKAAFREQARNLVFIDRERRKAKKVIDTAGMIASALERAYKYGFADAQKINPECKRTVRQDEDAVEWITIPSRAPRAFESVAYKQYCYPALDRYYVPAVTERGTPGWLLTWLVGQAVKRDARRAIENDSGKSNCCRSMT